MGTECRSTETYLVFLRLWRMCWWWWWRRVLLLVVNEQRAVFVILLLLDLGQLAVVVVRELDAAELGGPGSGGRGLRLVGAAVAAPGHLPRRRRVRALQRHLRHHRVPRHLQTKPQISVGQVKVNARNLCAPTSPVN